MTDHDITSEAEKPVWTVPVLEDAGTIHDVEGGIGTNLDGNGLPSHS